MDLRSVDLIFRSAGDVASNASLLLSRLSVQVTWYAGIIIYVIGDFHHGKSRLRHAN